MQKSRNSRKLVPAKISTPKIDKTQMIGAIYNVRSLKFGSEVKMNVGDVVILLKDNLLSIIDLLDEIKLYEVKFSAFFRIMDKIPLQKHIPLEVCENDTINDDLNEDERQRRCYRWRTYNGELEIYVTDFGFIHFVIICYVHSNIASFFLLLFDIVDRVSLGSVKKQLA